MRIANMIEQLEGTADLTAWEAEFMTNIAKRYHHHGKRTDFFTTKVLEIIERIWSRHFA